MSDIFLLRDSGKKFFVCECVIKRFLTKFGTQVLRRKISVEFVDGQNAKTVEKGGRFKYSKNDMS